MNENTQKLPEATDTKTSGFSNPIVVAVLFFIIGALVSGTIVFGSQKQMLKAAAEEEVKQYTKVKADYDKTKNDLNDWVEYGKEFKYKSIGGCSDKKCLFQGPEAVEGYGYLEGYYSTKKAIDWGDIPVTCDVLVTAGGSEELINDLLGWVKKGNTINAVDNKGSLMVNISLESLSTNDKNLIKNSTFNNTVKLKVVRVTPQGRAASACGSFVDIIAVQ